MSSGAFATGTKVPIAKSRAEIEAMVLRYGATSFVCGWTGNDATLLFEAKGRRIRFDLPLPDANDKQFAMRGGKPTPPSERVALRDAEHRRRWRALALVLKAKLEAVASGITSFDQEFLSHIVIPGGMTIGEWAEPEIARAYTTGAALPPLLGGHEPPRPQLATETSS